MHIPNHFKSIVYDLLKSIEADGVLLPTTNADIEYGKWLKEMEKKK